MKILNYYHQVSGGASEFTLQEGVDEFLKTNPISTWSDVQYEYVKLPQIVLREFRIPEIGRISDHILLINNRRVVNIESKLDDIGGVIKQAEDHLRWCDYSIVCLPPDGRYVANSYKQEIIEKGLGLWYWFKDIGIFEFILPRFNRKKDLALRKKVINRIHSQNPKTLFEEMQNEKTKPI